MNPIRILFMCTGNAARSQMAEGFARILPPTVKRLHWPSDDLAQTEGCPEAIQEVFRRSRDEFDRRVHRLLIELGLLPA